MTDTAELTQTLIQKIIDGDNLSAKDDFNALIGAKVSDMLDARKQAIAQHFYSDQPKVEDGQAEKTDDSASV